MEVKLFEIRDEGTHIDAMAVKTVPANEQECYLLEHSGYGRAGRKGAGGSHYVLLAEIAGGEGKIACDPYDWTYGRTMCEAHKYILRHFDELESGAVIDVEYIRGEAPEPKTSDRYWTAKAEVA